MRYLQDTGYVSATELSQLLGVSAVTIRGDLDALERDGRLLRTHGGAVPLRLFEGTLSFAARQGFRAEVKERIGAAAAEFVSDGEAIALDASTTAWHMARHLLSRRDLTVVTTGLYVALELLRSPSISVIMPGGLVWREAASIVGRQDGNLVAQGHLHRGFFGGRGLTVEEGLTDAHRDEVELKRQLVAQVKEVNVIIDGSKWGKVAFASCAALGQIHRIITDESAPEEQVRAIRDQGVAVIVA